MRKIMIALCAAGLLVAAGISVLRLGHPAKVRAQNGCSNATLQGGFGYTINGFTLAPGTLLMVPLAGAGRVKRTIYPPGFNWTQDMKPIVGTELCQHAHVGFLAQGQIHIRYADGCTLPR